CGREECKRGVRVGNVGGGKKRLPDAPCPPTVCTTPANRFSLGIQPPVAPELSLPVKDLITRCGPITSCNFSRFHKNRRLVRKETAMPSSWHNRRTPSRSSPETELKEQRPLPLLL